MKYAEYLAEAQERPAFLNKRWLFPSAISPQYGFGFRFGLDNGALKPEVVYLRTEDGMPITVNSAVIPLTQIADVPFKVLQAGCIMLSRLEVWINGPGHAFEFCLTEINGANFVPFEFDGVSVITSGETGNG